MRRRLLSLSLVLIGLAAAGSLACGGDDDGGGAAATATRAPATATTTAPSPTATTAAATPTAEASPAAGGARAMTLVDFGFTPGQLEARVGEQVALNVTNGGQRPHSFTIDGVVDSGVLQGNESKSIEFTPAAAGTLSFYCTVHGAARMSGEINVTGCRRDVGECMCLGLKPEA